MPKSLKGALDVGTGTPTWEDIHKEINTLPDKPHGDPLSDLPGPYEIEYNGENTPPQTKGVDYTVSTTSTDLLGGNMVLKNVVQQVLTWILGELGAIGAFIKPFLMKLLTDEGAVLAEVAFEAVTAVAADPSVLTGTVARDAAFAKIIAELKAKSLPVITADVNAAIEMAYQLYLAKKAAAVQVVAAISNASNITTIAS